MFRALHSTSYQGEDHGVGKGGEQGREQRWELQGKVGRRGTGTGTKKGEAGANGEGVRGWGQKGVSW